MQIRQQFLKPGFYGDPKTGLREITAADLAKYRDDTNAALSAGLPVPILDEHCDPTALDGPEAESIRTRGWLKKLHVNKDGSLSHESEVADSDVAAKIKAGTIKFVSPQLNPDFEKNGNSLGSIVRHLALTPKPVNPDQGAMEVLALSESDKSKPFAVSLSNYAGEKMPTKKKKPEKEATQLAEDDKKKPDEEEAVEEVAAETPPADEQETAETFTNSPGVDRASLLNQAATQLGLTLPEGMDLSSDEAVILVLTAVLNATQNDAEPEVPLEPIEEEQPEIAQFSEAETALLERIATLEARETARLAQQRRASFNLSLATSGAPPALAKRLKASSSSMQFSEDGAELPLYTPSQVLAICKDTYPPSVWNMAETATVEESTTEDEHPEGDDFFSDKDGRKPMSQQQAAQMAEETIPRTFSGSAVETTEQVHRTTGDQPPAPKKRGRPKGSGKKQTK